LWLVFMINWCWLLCSSFIILVALGLCCRFSAFFISKKIILWLIWLNILPNIRICTMNIIGKSINHLLWVFLSKC
jgi:hypothetical protein